MAEMPFIRVATLFAAACLALACRPTAQGGLADAGEPVPPAAEVGSELPGPGTGEPAREAPTVRVVAGATPEPAPPGLVVEPPDADPEEIPAAEDIFTLEAPAAWRGSNDLHLQLVMPGADEPEGPPAGATVAVEVELRKDGILRDPVVVRGRIEGERLAAGQVPVVFAGLKDEAYELVVRAFDRAGDALGEAERDFKLSGGKIAPFLVRLPAEPGKLAIEDAVRPYLQGGTPTRMTLLWSSARAVKPAITLTDAAGAAITALEGPPGTHHRFALTGLTPGTAYRWTAREAGAPIASGTFRTNAGAETRQVRFAAFGDSGKGTRAQFDVARRMAAWKPEFALIAGDIIYPRGEARHYGPRFLEPYQALIREVVFYPSLGNHDYMTDKGQPYLDFFEVPRAREADTERYYAFRWGHTEFFSLDSNQDLGPTSAQTRWLVRALEASTAIWKVAFFHHPPFSGGSHGSAEKLRDAWEPLFERHDVQLVITGHDHHYERVKPQELHVKDGVPTHHVLTGGGGAGLREVSRQPFTAHAANRHHFVGVTIADRTLSLEAIDQRGAVFDRWSYTLPK